MKYASVTEATDGPDVITETPEPNHPHIKWTDNLQNTITNLQKLMRDIDAVDHTTT